MCAHLYLYTLTGKLDKSMSSCKKRSSPATMKYSGSSTKIMTQRYQWLAVGDSLIARLHLEPVTTPVMKMVCCALSCLQLLAVKIDLLDTVVIGARHY